MCRAHLSSVHCRVPSQTPLDRCLCRFLFLPHDGSSSGEPEWVSERENFASHWRSVATRQTAVVVIGLSISSLYFLLYITSSRSSLDASSCVYSMCAFCNLPATFLDLPVLSLAATSLSWPVICPPLTDAFIWQPNLCLIEIPLHFLFWFVSKPFCHKHHHSLRP